MPTFSPYFLSALSAVLVSLAWWMPGSGGCAILGWFGVFFLVACVRSPKASYGAIGLFGIITNSLGFYWLFSTIKDFGGFDYFAAALIFLLFVVLSANQQIIFLFLYRRLPAWFKHSGLAIAATWVTTEFFSVRIFPWSLGHTQLAFTPFIQFADILGTPAIAFLMLWLSEALWRSLVERERKSRFGLPLLAAALACMYGQNRIAYFTAESSPKLPVTLIQANISIAEKHNVKFFMRNVQRYQELSAIAAKPGALVIWPESVITDFISDTLTSVSQDHRLPFLGPGTGMLVGALTYRSKEEFFNSAVAIMPDGQIAAPYHKRILMPFGEFTPFSGTFPWLKEINATAGEFTAGRDVSIFDYKFSPPSPLQVRVSPLICYEDIAPRLARDATLAGAEVLVNITNDAWFGDTVAPHQHHMIAAFRAVENRRFLVRSTNSGLTAIVDPLGQTVARVEPFSDGVLNYEVGLPKDSTLYTTLFGERLWWILSTLILLMSLINGLRRPAKEHVSAQFKKV